MRSRVVLSAVLLIGLSWALSGCALLQQFGSPPALKFEASPVEAERGTPLTILVYLVDAGRYGGLNVEELSVSAPDGTNYIYQNPSLIKEDWPFATTYPSPDWSGAPSVEQKGIYTIKLEGNYFRKGRSVNTREGEAMTRTVHVARGVVLGPIPPEGDVSSLAYIIDVDYPSRGYTVEVEQGSSVTLPVTIQSLADEPLGVRLSLIPAWSIPSSIQYETPEEYVAVKPGATVQTQITIGAAASAVTGSIELYLMGELEQPILGLSEETVPVHLRVDENKAQPM